ncbi:hypothetical protein FCH83_12340 [Pseudomonas putida]|nr:hypothetical protein [Pseudomonas putida]NTZ01274.1 hypothetical protein [Pseudomonas putida]NTZ21857.1 hypothetical protein [Pseudomonas putida]NTZ55382.1 hypothetical protein [Pseudomonas putida]NTZ65682.1 hypothetical protein [Pseudomonas putida]
MGTMVRIPPPERAREQSSELVGYAQDLTIEGLMETNPVIIWAGQPLCALGKALLDDALSSSRAQSLAATTRPHQRPYHRNEGSAPSTAR